MYLQTAGDGDQHALAQPDSVRPPTAAELLTRILARDGAQTSATSTQRQLADPAGRLADEADRYLNSLTVAATKAFRHDDRAGAQPLPLDDDPSARRPGPLPWLPPIPAALAAHPVWGGYLTDRAQHVQDLARHTAEVPGGWTMSTAPAWATPLLAAAGQDDCQLVARLAVWRAAHRVPGSDPRPTGPPLPHGPLTIGQQALDDAVDRVLAAAPSTTSRYGDLAALEPRLATEPGWAQLITRLDATPETVDLAPSPFRPSGTARCPTSCPRQRCGGDSRAPCPPSRASRSSPHR